MSILIAGVLLYWIGLGLKKEFIGRLAKILLIIALVDDTTSIIIRMIISGHAPLTNGYEFLLTFHVVTAMFAYGAFATSFGVGVMYLLKRNKEDKGIKESDQGLIARFPSLEFQDELSYKVVGFAFPLLTLCIITGAIWANYAWGTYWLWEPKETH